MTDQLGGTTPNWPRMTSQVDPQISVTIANGIRTQRAWPSGAAHAAVRVGAGARSGRAGQSAAIASASGGSSSALLVPRGDQPRPRPAPSRRSRSPCARRLAASSGVARRNTSLASTGWISRSPRRRARAARAPALAARAVGEPQIVLEHREDLRGEIAPLG